MGGIRSSAIRNPQGPVRVLVGGTFDGLHIGHLFLLRFARRCGRKLAKRLGRSGVHLSVVVARDESVRRIKGRAPCQGQTERCELVIALEEVDAAFIGARDDFLRSVRRARPDLIVLGYDQGQSWESSIGSSEARVRIVRCPPYGRRRIKSSLLREEVRKLRT